MIGNGDGRSGIGTLYVLGSGSYALLRLADLQTCDGVEEAVAKRCLARSGSHYARITGIVG